MSGVTGDDGTAAKFYKGANMQTSANKWAQKRERQKKTTIDLENNAWMVAFAPLTIRKSLSASIFRTATAAPTAPSRFVKC